MKLAHIVPVTHLDQTSERPYHMCLAHLVLSVPSYALFYRRLVEEGKFVIMDNGAAEGEQLSLEDLATAYDLVKPNELVMLDSLNDGDETFEKTKRSIEFFTARGIHSRFMAVPQGKTFEQWKRSADQLLRLPRIETIGVSKFLSIATQDNTIRIAAVDYLKDKIGMHDIHLLGCQTEPREVRTIAEEYPFVRGCDTALAYLFAQQSRIIEIDTPRPPGEIGFVNGVVDRISLNQNIREFDKIIGGKL